jgi:TIGR03009 family protein
MRTRIGAWTVIGLLAMAAPAAAQGQYGQGSYPPRRPATQPYRPAPSTEYSPYPSGQTPYRVADRQAAAQPQYTGQPPYAVRPPSNPPGQTPAALFPLTPQQQAQVDWVLRRWEQQSAGVKTFECKFTRFVYDPVWPGSGDPNKPRYVDEGEIRYAAPDKGLFRVYQPRGAGPERREHWISNGKSIFQYDFQKQELVEYPLPPEMQGKAIANGPLPFLFGATADHLRGRYFLRIVTPADRKDQVWLEAYPRFQADAANFRQATLILTLSDMRPFALQLVEPNGQNRTVYRFQDPKVNSKNLLDPLGWFENNWARPRIPAGWTKRVEEPPAVQAGRPPATQRRR